MPGTQPPLRLHIATGNSMATMRTPSLLVPGIVLLSHPRKEARAERNASI